MPQFKHRTGNVSGRITDRDNGKPLFGVNLAVSGTDIQAKTDLRGRFHIPHVPAGECTLKCSLPGYKALPDLKVKVIPGKTVPRDCRLVCKQRIPLNEPVVLLPLRLEIRKLVPHSGQKVSVANYTRNTRNVSAAASENFRPFETKSDVQ
ncbi:MAG: carboxypeptidase-like regulatory domain-containing protein, partial [bacterium]|nr:carboxypeptidase-like regulatory domain-containing protein [bacterium]